MKTEENKPTRKDGILQIIYKNLISEKIQRFLRYVSVKLSKWLTGFFIGLGLGLFAYYYWDVYLGKKQFDWKIVASLMASIGVIITTIFIYLERFLKLAVYKAEYHILENKDVDSEKISNILAK